MTLSVSDAGDLSNSTFRRLLGGRSVSVESTDDDEIHDAFHVSGANVYEGCLYIHEDEVLT